MSYLNKVFCASPQCKNECGRQMTDKEREGLSYLYGSIDDTHVEYDYFCGQPNVVYLTQKGNLKGI